LEEGCGLEVHFREICAHKGDSGLGGKLHGIARYGDEVVKDSVPNAWVEKAIVKVWLRIYRSVMDDEIQIASRLVLGGGVEENLGGCSEKERLGRVGGQPNGCEPGRGYGGEVLGSFSVDSSIGNFIPLA